MQIKTKPIFRIPDPIFASGGNYDAVMRFMDIQADYNRRRMAWLEGLANEGVALVHPDDGWVNRKENYLDPVYPDFDRLPEVGDTIVLGDLDKYRYVAVIKVEDRYSTLDPDERKRYWFEPKMFPYEKHKTRSFLDVLLGMNR